MMMQIDSYRGRKRRVPVITALAAAAAMALTGCASAGGNADAGTGGEEVRVAYIGSKGTTFENAVYNGLDSVDRLTADFIEVGFDASKQAQAIDDAVASGKYQGIVVSPRSATSLIPSVKRAIDAGMRVVNIGGQLGPDDESVKVQLPGQTASIVVNFETYAELEWKLALQYCEKEGMKVCNVARIGATPEHPSERIYARMDKAAAEAAGGKANRYETIFAGGWDAALGLKAGQDLLTSHPDVNVIIAADPNMKGVEKAVASAGKDVALIGDGGTVYGLEQVRKGAWYGTVAHFPFTNGELAGEAILRHVADPTLEGETISPVLDGVGPAFTKENADSFEAQYE